MGGYLTVEEAAERLGVEYKTVYRLVRGGQVPAGKVGRVYRIREEDLEEYFERQKQKIASEAQRESAADGLRCGACGRQVLSELSIGGRCEVTDQPICQACWSIKKIRTCMPDTERDPAGDSAAQVLLTAAPGAAATTTTGETTEEVIARLRAEGRAVITADESGLAEETFLRTFAQRLEHVDALPDPLSGLTIRLRDARVKHEIEPTQRAAKPLPRNRISRFTLRAGGWGKPKACLVVEGRFLARPDAIARAGYDDEAVGEAELTRLLNDLAEPAQRSECFRVVWVGSPTGWTEAAAALVTDRAGAKGFHDRRVAVALCDLHSDRVILDESDERLRPFWPLLAPRRFAEQVARCVAGVRDALVERDSLSLSDAARRLAADDSWVRAAFSELKATGEFVTEELPEIGLVISCV